MKHYLVFETGAMGGFKSVTGFRLTAKGQRNCLALQMNKVPQKTGNGIFIGEELRDFRTKFNIKFDAVKNSTLTYENVSQREATPEELERLRKAWPDERETRLDVTVSINAQFKNNKLVDYYVRKIESY